MMVWLLIVGAAIAMVAIVVRDLILSDRQIERILDEMDQL